MQIYIKRSHPLYKPLGFWMPPRHFQYLSTSIVSSNVFVFLFSFLVLPNVCTLFKLIIDLANKVNYELYMNYKYK
jgi:hypothetical protein